MEHVLFGIASVIVLGISAQWVAWRFKVPSILLLLIFGFLAGPVTGFLDVDTLMGDLLFPLVSISVGIILFEGGLSLQLRELHEVGGAVRKLITTGTLITWVLAAAAAYFLAGFNPWLAVLIGAILTVTGPTVVIPLLRHVRPTGRVGTVAKWEGITIDPIGAILAVLVLEAIILANEPATAGGGFASVALHTLEGLLLEIIIGVGVSVMGAGLLILLLHRRLIPDYLINSVALALVVLVFTVSEALQHESGLLSTTLMGILMANQPYVPVRRIVEFKEDLRVLLIGGLFVLLSARLNLSALSFIDAGAVLFVAALMLIVRPVAVFVSLRKADLERREKIFLAWLAPRGIVAAAVAALFSFRLQEIYPAEVPALVPLIFLVIVSTVAIYGLTISPLARRLGLAHPNPQGVLFVGAQPWAQKLATAVQKKGFRVLLIDANPRNVRNAQRAGLPAQRANALSEAVIDDLDLGGIGRLVALTLNDEVNALAALNFSELFESSEIYQLALRQDHDKGEMPKHLRGQPLFGPEINYAYVTDRFENGAAVETVTLTKELPYKKLLEHHNESMLPLFIIRGDELHVVSKAADHAPQTGDTLIALIDPSEVEVAENEHGEVIVQIERVANDSAKSHGM